jgi:hypothetical protein
MIDIAMRYILGPAPNMLSKKNAPKPPKENKYENPLKNVEIDTSLDEEDDFAEPQKKKNKKIKKEKKEKESVNEEKEEEKNNLIQNKLNEKSENENINNVKKENGIKIEDIQ